MVALQTPKSILEQNLVHMDTRVGEAKNDVKHHGVSIPGICPAWR